jgi:branched-subunit amino acid transport protein
MSKILIFLGMSLATYFTRYSMIAALGGKGSRETSKRALLLERWLRYLPPAILAALVVPEVLAPHGRLEIGLALWATLIGGIVAWRTRNALWTVLVGMVAYWLLRLLGV